MRWFAGRFGLHYKQVRITSAQTRWGSCSASGALSFTWRLVMAPPAAIDYVVVHELAHLLVHNHSPAFWSQGAAAGLPAAPPVAQTKRPPADVVLQLV